MRHIFYNIYYYRVQNIISINRNKCCIKIQKNIARGGISFIYLLPGTKYNFNNIRNFTGTQGNTSINTFP